VLILVNLLMVAHFVQWRVSGRTISPIEPSETIYTLQNGAINAGFVFFALAIFATLILGRFVCGWGCHILALQDFCGWILQRMGLKPQPFRSRLLVYVPLIAALYMFVWPTARRFLISAEPGPLIPKLTNHLTTDNFWETFPSVGVAIPFLFICGFLIVYFLGQKGFCTYACPYGGFFGVADKLAPLRIRVTDACNQCGHCTATCTSNVQVHAEVKAHKMVVDAGCMKCMDCISVCPNDALYLGFGRPALGAGQSPKSPGRYSITWGEEILGAVVFLGTLLALRGVYGLVPFLMALGCAAVTTFLALKTWRLLGRNDVFFHRFMLKTKGRIQTAGWAFLICAAGCIGLAVHSGWIRYHEFAGTRAFQKLQIPDELALAQVNPASWLGPVEKEDVLAGRSHLETALDAGLFANPDVVAKLAWFDYLSGAAERSVPLLEQAAEHQKGRVRALSLYYRGAILNRLGRYQEASASLDEALRERADLILAREQEGESLWQLGRKEEAISAWRGALERNPHLALTGNFLAGAARSLGKLEEAAAYEKQADEATPDDALYHDMIALRLEKIGMRDLAAKHFQRANKLGGSLNR
jgi:Flp pilus assembly protein TadD/NAD-dependent dihydropyrimidine dehydrogenase PreA subunit